MPQGPPQRDKDTRFGVLAGLGVAGFGLVVLGLLRLQVLQHDELLRLADQNRIRLDVIRAPRGAIRDRSGRILADNQPSFDIVFRPAPIESTLRVRAVVASDWLARVSGAILGDSNDVKRRVQEANRTGETAVLRRAAPYAVMAAVEESRSDLAGLDVQVAPMRRYPAGTLAAQLLGYAGEINDRELQDFADKGYGLGDLIGKTGVERRYEDVLRGQDGAEFVVVNAMGKRVTTLEEGPPRLPVPGHDVTLTIDLTVQHALEEAMARVERGAAVVLDPRDGSVLAMVSKPEFDPNEFSRGISFSRWKELNSNGAFPLLNRATQSAYPPGSTFKIVCMLAALKTGEAEPDTHMPTTCTGGYFFGGRRFACWEHRGHGSLDLVEALQHSCDVYFYQLGLHLGIDPIQQMARAVGLGERTGIDLPSEAKGLVPTSQYYNQHFHTGHWPRGVLLNLGIGQGELLATPVQLATMTAVVAGNGHAVRPHVVQSIQGQEGFRIERPLEPGVVTDRGNWETVHLAMHKVTLPGGTANASRSVPGMNVAGKTGTAQNPHGNDHALFVCFAPLEAPTIAMAIVAENSGHGSEVAAPIAGALLKKLFAPDTAVVAARIPHPTEAVADTAADSAAD
jgi:penicillin-binding protein 2